ncbi:hypothetical protein [Mucilaginibacter sp.]
MTDTLHILIAGRHCEIVPTLVRLLNNTKGWQPVGTLSNQETVACMDAQAVDVLLLSSGLSGEDELQLREHLTATHPKAVTIQHYGGGSGLLTAEIYEAINKP